MTSGPGMVIVGAGQCGARAALTLREAGYDGPVTLAKFAPARGNTISGSRRMRRRTMHFQ